MSPARTASDGREFAKRPDCPSSGALLAYSGNSLAGLRGESVRLHLTRCDFCNAELRLLGEHPPVGEVTFALANLPLSLLLLAGQSLPKGLVLKKPSRRRAA